MKYMILTFASQQDYQETNLTITFGAGWDIKRLT